MSEYDILVTAYSALEPFRHRDNFPLGYYDYHVALVIVQDAIELLLRKYGAVVTRFPDHATLSRDHMDITIWSNHDHT